MELVTLATYRSPHDAELARSALDAAGIESFIEDAHVEQVTAMPVGVKLRVREEDAERAQSVLDSTAEPQTTEIHLAQPIIEPGCPECGSHDIARTRYARNVGLIVALILVIAVATRLTEAAFYVIVALAVFALVAGRWRCAECGESWR